MTKLVHLPFRGDRLIENDAAWSSHSDESKAVLLNESAKAQIYRALALHKNGLLTESEAFDQVLNYAKIALQAQSRRQL